MLLFKQAFVLILSFLLIFLWQQSPFSESNYIATSLGLLVFFYFMLSRKKKKPEGTWSEIGGVFILNTLILILIFSTGGIHSTLFFLLYFLVFGISFIFEPAIVFLFAIGIVLIFLQQALKDDVVGNFIKLASIFIISPIAFFFGKEYAKRNDQKNQIQQMEENATNVANTIESDVQTVLNSEKQTLKKESVKKLGDVLKEAEMLREDIE